MKRKPVRRTGIIMAMVTTFCLMVTTMASIGVNRAYAATQASYYVSPSGDDTYSGDQAHPFKTLEKAKQVVRTINASMTGDIVVYLMDGTYQLGSTFQLSESATVHDSGSNGYNIIYRAYPNAHPVLSGGTTLGSWAIYDTNKNIYRSYVGQSTGILQMYVNGVRATVARGQSGPSGFSTVLNPWLVIDAFKVHNGANVTTVNDNDPGITYTNAWTYDGGGNWAYGSNRSNDYNSDAHIAYASGASATYTFTGTGIDLISETNTTWTAGIQIYIDGVLDQTVSSQGAAANQQVVYSKSGLTSGSHTIKVVNGMPQHITTSNSQYSNMASWRNPTQIEVVSENKWVVARCPFASVSGGNITLQQPCVGSILRNYFVVSWLENAYELLGTPGQFYYDISDGYAYYVPRPYEDLSTANVVVPRVEQLVNGTGAAGTPLHNIQFIGLAFQHGTWLQALTSPGVSGDQGDYYVCAPGFTYDCPAGVNSGKMAGNVVFNNASNIVIQANTFSKLGGTGLVFENESQQNLVVGNSFSDISAGGLLIGDTYDFANTSPSQQSINNRVIDNYVSSIGVEYRAATGFFFGYNANLQVRHSELDHMPYSGISVGWGWGYETPTPYSKNNTISNNKVSNVMERLNDGGGIYTLSSQPGSIITGNYVAGVYRNYAAIYLDNGTAGYNVNNNVIQNYVPTWLLVQQISPVAHDNTVINNYTENGATTGGPNSNGNSTTNTTILTPGSWPSAAVSIANNAGLESGYSQLKNTAGVMVNDNQSGITYSGTWTYDSNRHAAGVNDYMNDVHYTSTSGDYVQYSFMGTGIDVVAETHPGFTTSAKVYIDSVLQSTVAENNSYGMDGQIVYSISGLSAGSHTIQIVNNASSFLVVDGFKVYDSIAPVSVTGISLGQSQIAMNVGDTLDLNASVTVAPSNATNGQIVWTSDSPAVATVAGGSVNAISAGSTVITATTLDGGFVASVTVTVSNVAVTGVALTPSQVLSEISSTYDFKPGLVISPSNATNKQVTWSSSNTSIATVSNGVVTGVALGSAVITVTTVDGNFTATANVTIGQNVALTATATASSYWTNNSSFAPSKAVDGNLSTEWASYNETNPWLQLNWSSNQTVSKITFYDRPNLSDWTPGGTLYFSDGSTLTVSGIPNDGSPYTVSFTARVITWVKFQIAGGSSSTNVGLAEIKVWQALPSEIVSVTGVTLNPSQTITDVGGTLDLKPGLVVSPSNATNKQVTWSSSNTSIATVSNGVVTGVALGSAVITATTVDGNFTATATIAIGQNVAGSATATASSYYQNNAAYAPSKAIDGNLSTEWASYTQTNPWLQLNWSSSQTVSAITFYDRVNLNDWTQGGTLYFSDGTNLAISGIPNDGSPYTVSFTAKTITWVKFQIAGGSSTTNVGLAEIKVWQASGSVAGVTLSPSQTITDVGGTLDLKPGLVIAPRNAANQQVTWSSSNTSIATVSNGVVTGVALGSAVITVTTVDGNFTATANVTIGQNVALTATATASSYWTNNSSFAPSKAVDGNLSTEWASYNETNPWLQLNWSSNQTVSKITFYDRPNLSDWTPGGTLYFSDGSTLTVSGIPNDGSPYTVSFTARVITWVKFQIAGGSSSTNVGLAEIKVWQ